MRDSKPVALVTGGARGIGLATSRHLAERGYHAVLADFNEEWANSAAAELRATGLSAEPAHVDVTDRGSVDEMFARVIAESGRLDTLVTCAGITDQGDSSTMTDESWSRMLSTHLDGTFRCCRAAYETLKQSPIASIVTVSSVVAQLGLPKRLSYAVAKNGVEGLTRTLAVEWASDGIRVNSIAPGWTRTLQFDAAVISGVVDEARLVARIPMGRLALPEEIARAIGFLCSSDASYISGQVLVADGCVSIGFST
jgi:NAD(P)-dependent dehydrogenase (short-subunit alcohol dehydrogenase family)